MRGKKSCFSVVFIFFFILLTANCTWCLLVLALEEMLDINSFLPLPSLIFQTSIKTSFSCLFFRRTSPCLLSQSKNSIQYSFSSSLPFFEPFCRGGWELRSMDLCSSKNVFYLFSLLSLITLSMLFSFSSLSELWKVPEQHIIAPVSLPRYFAEHRSLPLICKITFFPTHVHYTTFTQIELYLSILFPR